MAIYRHVFANLPVKMALCKLFAMFYNIDSTHIHCRPIILNNKRSGRVKLARPLNTLGNDISIFFPGGDGYAFYGFVYKCLDVSAGQTGVREQRNVVVDGPAAYAVAVGQLAFGMVLRDINH